MDWEFDAFFDYSTWMVGIAWDPSIPAVVMSIGPLVCIAYRP